MDECKPLIHGLGIIGTQPSENMSAEDGLALHNSGLRATVVTASEDRIASPAGLQERLHLLPKARAYTRPLFSLT